jgi:hypothetical protein
MTSAPVFHPGYMPELPKRRLTPDEIVNLARPRLLVYNPAPDPEVVEVAGIPYFFPPLAAIPIDDQYEYELVMTNKGLRPDFGGGLETPPVGVRGSGAKLKRDCDSASVASRICSPEFRGLKGFTTLVGDGYDEERMKEARGVYRTFRLEKCRETQKAWHRICADATQEPGSVPPRQPEWVRRDLEFLWEEGTNVQDRKPFVCRLDSHEADSRAEMERWIRRMYPGQPVDENIMETRNRATAIEEPKRIEISEAGMELIERAAHAGLELSIADRRGLRAGDAEILNDVGNRLTVRAAQHPTQNLRTVAEVPPAEEPAEVPAAPAKEKADGKRKA